MHWDSDLDDRPDAFRRILQWAYRSEEFRIRKLNYAAFDEVFSLVEKYDLPVLRREMSKESERRIDHHDYDPQLWLFHCLAT